MKGKNKMKNNASVKEIMSRGRAVVGNEFTKAFVFDKPIAVIRESENSVRLTQRKLTKKMQERNLSSITANQITGTCQLCVSKYFKTTPKTVVIFNALDKQSDVIIHAL